MHSFAQQTSRDTGASEGYSTGGEGSGYYAIGEKGSDVGTVKRGASVDNRSVLGTDNKRRIKALRNRIIA